MSPPNRAAFEGQQRLRAGAHAFKTERAGERRPFKPKRWNHQQKLDQLKGKKIDFLYIGAVSWATGILVDSDQFSLEIQMELYQSALTVFKHDLRAFKEA